MRRRAMLALLLSGCPSQESDPAPMGSSSGSSSTSTSTGSTTTEPDTEAGTTATFDCTPLGTLLADIGFDASDACWEWIREDPSAWRTDAAALELRSLPGTLWLENNSTRNFAVRPWPEGASVTIDVHVSGAIADPAEQGGLLAYVDDDNYIKLVKEQVGQRLAVVMVTETAGMPVVDGNPGIDGDEAWLRLVVSADGVSSFVREAADDPWQEVASIDLPAWWSDPSLRLGVFTQGASEERWLRFDALTVSMP